MVKKEKIMKTPDTSVLLRKVNDSPKLAVFLRILCYGCTFACVFAFGYMLVHFILMSLVDAICFLAVLGVPFVLVSLMRRWINAPRPYELYDFYTTPPKKKKGDSFPSRHAFSAFAIGTLCMIVNPIIGIITLSFGLLMCFCRVALGIHFIRDVLAGSIIGAVSSVIGVLILL